MPPIVPDQPDETVVPSRMGQDVAEPRMGPDIPETHQGQEVRKSRPGRKAEDQHQRLVEAAAEVFLRNGYGLTSIDAIAAEARASKKTLYAYFSGKEEIFVATLERLCDEVLAPLHRLDCGTGDVRHVLEIFGMGVMAELLKPRAVELYRLAISEAVRFPQLSRLFYQKGPSVVHALLTHRLQAMKDKGEIALASPDKMASLFVQMVIGEAQRRVVMAVSGPPAVDEARAHVRTAVDVLIRVALPSDGKMSSAD